ncbi:MAG TPA: hypothetical protein VNN08_16430 [Thermoanaerobaculia bacterium]|nr:hypothetical protein [Thermoanaerobaculia bacterium]
MIRRTLLSLLALLVAAVALGDDCAATSPRFELNAATQNPTITFPKDTMPSTIVAGAAVKLVIGGGTPVEATVTDVTTNAFIGGSIVTLHASQPLNGPIEGTDASGLTTATVTLLPPTGNAIALCGLTPLNYSFHIGPTVSADSSSTGTGDPAGVMRFQFSRGLLRLVQVSSDPTLIPAARNLQEELSVSIDTTDRKGTGTQFIDDNRLTGAIRSPEKSFGIVLNRVRVGLEGQFARAIHSEDRNTDVTIVVDGWLPFFQAVNLLSQSRTRTLPLSFRLSAGRRSQNVSGVSSNGNVADGVVTYHLYLLDHYAVDLSEETVLNDVSDRPASTPRTQHSYKAAIFYKADPFSKFSAVASYENGHSGPVFTKLRQYFVGVGIQQLFAPSTAKP